MKIIIDGAIGSPVNGKDIVDDLNAINKFYLGGGNNRLSKIITTTCEGLGMFHSDPVG